jgi:lactose/L-arabinose transport system permease protein
MINNNPVAKGLSTMDSPSKEAGMGRAELHKKPLRLSQFVIYAFLAFLVLVTVYPVYWMVLAGTYKTSFLIHFIFTLTPGKAVRDNYRLIGESFDMIRVILNTFYTALAGTFLALFVNLTMAYAFAKYRFKGKRFLFNFLLVTMFMGGAVALIPQFEIIYRLGLYNRLEAIFLPTIYSTYITFLSVQVLRPFPSEIMESGRIDGCGEFRIFQSLVIPNILPLVMTVAIISFAGYWNSYIWNLIVTSSVDKFTLQVALAGIYPKAAMWTYAPMKMLGATISIIPLLVLFISMQKYYINSLTGAVKG